jgi:hypothetical protein
MKTFLIFLCVVLAFFSYSDLYAGTCEQRDGITSVYYGNGVSLFADSAFDDANASLKLIRDDYKKKYPDEELDFDLAFNRSRGVFLDLLEVFDQKFQETGGLTTQQVLDMVKLEKGAIATLIEELLILTGAGSEFGIAVGAVDKAVDALIEYLKDEAPSDDFYRWNTQDSHLEKYLYDLRRKKRVIVIAHSQGNLFANYAVEKVVALNSSYYPSIGIVGVASPAEKPLFDNQYVTAHDDRVIDALRHYYTVLPSNIENDPSVWFWKDDRDQTNHLFERSYFTEGLKSRERIDDMFGNLLRDLQFPPDKFCIMEDAFEKAYEEQGGIGILGDMTAEGSHCWSDSGDNPECINGVWIRDYRKGATETALIYNREQEKAWLMSEVFWGYYKVIGGNEALGVPEEDAYRVGDKYVQNFEHGKLEWIPDLADSEYTYPEWGIVMHIDGRFIPSDEDYVPPVTDVVVPGISTSYGHPDMKISTVTLSKGAHSKRHHKLEQDPEEKFYAYAKIKNVGTARAEDFKVKFYLDGGKKNFDRDDDDYQGSVRIEEFDSGAEIRYSKEIASPEEPGDYYIYACITSIDEDSDKSNNCSDEDDKEEYGKLIVEDLTPPAPADVDLIIDQLQLTHGRTSLEGGELYGLEVAITNIGSETPQNGFRTRYEIKGPGTGNQWQQVADDGSDAGQLAPGTIQWESISDGHGAHIPLVAGTYIARACADYQGAVQEINEGNNCAEFDFYVSAPAFQRSITVTNPTHDDEWRSDERKHIEWTTENLSSSERVKIEYSLDGGDSWRLLDDTAVNDGGKYWDMCDFHTVDTDDGYIRITSLTYPNVVGLSDEFDIDHAKECE